MSDYILAHHPEDIRLNGISIDQIGHADDIMTAYSCPCSGQTLRRGAGINFSKSLFIERFRQPR